MDVRVFSYEPAVGNRAPAIDMGAASGGIVSKVMQQMAA
jgi:hypothetical protein